MAAGDVVVVKVDGTSTTDIKTDLEAANIAAVDHVTVHRTGSDVVYTIIRGA